MHDNDDRFRPGAAGEADLPEEEWDEADEALLLEDEEEYDDGPMDLAHLVAHLVELLDSAKKVPFSNRVMFEEPEVRALAEALRLAVPSEIRQAQIVIHERETIIDQAQRDAESILASAREQAEYIVSQQGILEEARQRAEELLRQVDAEHKRSLRSIDEFALQQFSRVEESVQEGLRLIMDAVRESSENMESAKKHIGN